MLFVFFLRLSRRTFDTSESETEIGPFVIKFGKVSHFAPIHVSSFLQPIGYIQ